MATFSCWLDSNWSNVIQDIGILGSLWLANASFRRDSKDRLKSELSEFSQHSDTMWNKFRADPKLQRVFAQHADLSEPPTSDEVECLNQLFKMFQNGWRIVSSIDREEMRCLALDVADFFNCTLPKAVWEHDKVYKHRQFVRFVKRAIAANERANQRI